MNPVRTSPLARRGLQALVACALIAAAPSNAQAGRPNIFDLQNYLKQLPEKQKAREAADRKSAPIGATDAKPGLPWRGKGDSGR